MKKTIKKLKVLYTIHVHHYLRSIVWFGVGVIFGLFFLISFAFIIFQQLYAHSAFPGITINGINVGGKSEAEIQQLFASKDEAFANTIFTFVSDQGIATASAKDIDAGFDAQLLAQQAISIGKSKDVLSNISLVFQAYLNGINLSSSYTFSQDKLQNKLSTLLTAITVSPVDAVFQFSGGRVTTFKPSSNGQEVDLDSLSQTLTNRISLLAVANRPEEFTISLPIKNLPPKVATGDANNLGITELISSGTSLFQHSIPSRVFNVTLAASRLNGVLVAPNEEFSFDKALGDVSSYTGYQQAYVIQDGHTVLGDGGGVCQVSTTLFRAILNAGLPITERHAHDYRVGYYEEDSPPGIDATVYVPTVDLKFRNDTGHYILIQTVVDPSDLRLTFYLYGTKDGRDVTMTTPVVTDETPAPPDLYQDDPTLPKGQIKQIDFSANGAHVSFSRTVTKDGKAIINDTFVSNYRPWQAVYLVGTKE